MKLIIFILLNPLNPRRIKAEELITLLLSQPSLKFPHFAFFCYVLQFVYCELVFKIWLVRDADLRLAFCRKSFYRSIGVYFNILIVSEVELLCWDV